MSRTARTKPLKRGLAWPDDAVVMNADGLTLPETDQAAKGRRRVGIGAPVAWCGGAIAVLVLAVILRRIPHGGAGVIGFLASIAVVVVLNSARIVTVLIDAHGKN